MRNWKKYILGIVSMFLLFFMSGNSMVYAAETSGKDNVMSVSGKIVMPRSFTENGVVEGDGVRLRANPNTNATVLELMYWGESVQIDLSNSTMTFYYVKRNKTGTVGYVSRDYVSITQIVR